MQKKAFILQNRGMNRDLSVSKAGQSSAYENHNIRIIARDHDTLLSVTNERGTKEIKLAENFNIAGTLIGWNVLNNHLILFTHDEGSGLPDYIYRVDYDGTDFRLVRGSEYDVPLFNGNLNLQLDHPIESVVYFETEEIQKIYWVDGFNVLRFLNFMADDKELAKWDTGSEGYVTTYFDSNRAVDYGVKVSIEKDNSGTTRANGTNQYLLTYYNLHGQESGYVWVSDLVYLAPPERGGAADETNSNRIVLRISNLSTKFTHFRIYSIFRSSLDGDAIANIVFEGETSSSELVVVDDGAHLTNIDPTQLLYLGSKDVRPGTLAHKDQTLFLGDLKSIGRNDYETLSKVIRDNMTDGKGNSTCITFIHSYEAVSNESLHSIPFTVSAETYTYDNQLKYTSSQIKTFKGGEKYRFALVFHEEDGTTTDAFWIGDAVNYLYPSMSSSTSKIHRVIAQCEIPSTVLTAIKEAGFKTVNLMIAEATYADRSVKAQGIVSPTVFNVWNRYNNGVYAIPSWIERPRRAGFATGHFDVLDRSTESTGELECNYWGTVNTPTPYYRLQDYNTSKEQIIGDLDDDGNYDFLYVRFGIKNIRLTFGSWYDAVVVVTKAKLLERSTSAEEAIKSFSFSNELYPDMDDNKKWEYTDGNETIHLVISNLKYESVVADAAGIKSLWTNVCASLSDFHDLPSGDSIPFDVFQGWCDAAKANASHRHWFCQTLSGDTETTDNTAGTITALNTGGAGRWKDMRPVTASQTSHDYVASYYKKHLMFVDENVVTLNSPEIEYEAVNFDNAENYRFRIVGIAKIAGTQSDYTVTAAHGKLPGENLIQNIFAGQSQFKNKDGFISGPLWQEYGLTERKLKEDGETSYTPDDDVRKRTSYDYLWGGNTVLYWLHMWNHQGKINGYTDWENQEYSTLNSKTIANLRYSNVTLYNGYKVNERSYPIAQSGLRVFNYTSSQYLGLKVGDELKYYDGVIKDSISMPGTHKYPILYSNGNASRNSTWMSENAYLFSNTPVSIEFASTPHAVIALPTRKTSNSYEQTILPYISGADKREPEGSGDIPGRTGSLLPWIDKTLTISSSLREYSVHQDSFVYTRQTADADRITSSDKYVFIGEIYYDYDDASVEDTRYGGTTEAAIENCRFITAGKQYAISEMSVGRTNPRIYATEGDTFFQRWDCMKTKPYSNGALNNVIDITSVMLETHINVDGRSDNQRGTRYLASLDTSKFGSINRVYSQKNNFFVSRDLREDYNLDTYRSSITWTLQKSDMSSVDAWTHITLANSLSLDGDKGVCQALRRFQNSLIAFQDRGISEILFNSRTQISTTDGVPIEIGNSGKVDGKRYITNKYGCTNKWSIVEGKSALYFVDNINKVFCGFGGNSIEPLSTRFGFDVWFRKENDTKPWNPKLFNNFVSFYDRVHSDVYVVKASKSGETPALVYNEMLGAFTSFYDYDAVPMMTNIEDKFVSFKNYKLWLQNEGAYCNFFGEQKDFWIQYRVTPEPYSDKIWTNVDYRADFYRVLDGETDVVNTKEYSFADDVDIYQKNETFDYMRFWNEYQTTEHEENYTCKPIKKFRIWRLAIPRAIKSELNPHGLDRIRNPWLNLLFKKRYSDDKPEERQDLMQLHDIIVTYFE